MTLRKWFQAVTIGLLSMIVALSAALILTTHRVQVTSALLSHHVRRAQTAVKLSRSLAAHRRESLAYSLTADKQYLDDMQRFEQAAESALGPLVSGAADGNERRECEQIREAAQHYLDEADRAGAGPPSRMAALDSAFQAARDAASNFSTEQLATLTAYREATNETATAAMVFGGLTIVLSVLGSLLIIFSLRGRLVQPLGVLLEQIRKFRSGMLPPGAPALTGEFGDLEQALRKMMQTILDHRNAQLTFVSGVAHDLRNPLTSMNVAADLIGPTRPPPTGERLEKIHSVLKAQLHRLNRQLDDLLDSTRIEAGQLRLSCEEADLSVLVREAVELFDPSEQHRVKVAASGGFLARIDRLRLHQVVLNLLSNAIKYSPNGTPVSIELIQEGDWAVIAVRDQGLGISREDLLRLFEPFHRGRAAELKIPGTGLGLSVSQKIVVAHGGRLSVESELGQGSVFRIFLPLAGTAAPSEVRAS
jgi:signal transduction histidine kinase